jgi:tetratricopeptide (TPR) repeat protein
VRIDAKSAAKSLIFDEKYIMPPVVNRPAIAAIAPIVPIVLMAAVFCAVPVSRAQTTVLPLSQQTSDFQEATALFRSGQYDRALDRVDAWLKPRPKDARGRFLRGMILTQQKKLDDAERVYTDLTQDFPELPEPYNNLAVIYAERGDLNRARSQLEAALRANPKFTAAHENLGDIHTRLAAASYEQVLKLDAGNKGVADKLKAVNDLIPPRAPMASKP